MNNPIIIKYHFSQLFTELYAAVYHLLENISRQNIVTTHMPTNIQILLGIFMIKGGASIVGYITLLNKILNQYHISPIDNIITCDWDISTLVDPIEVYLQANEIFYHELSIKIYEYNQNIINQIYTELLKNPILDHRFTLESPSINPFTLNTPNLMSIVAHYQIPETNLKDGFVDLTLPTIKDAQKQSIFAITVSDIYSNFFTFYKHLKQINSTNQNVLYTGLGFELYVSYIGILFYRYKQETQPNPYNLYKIENYKNKIVQILKIISKCYPFYVRNMATTRAQLMQIGGAKSKNPMDLYYRKYRKYKQKYLIKKHHQKTKN